MVGLFFVCSFLVVLTQHLGAASINHDETFDTSDTVVQMIYPTVVKAHPFFVECL